MRVTELLGKVLKGVEVGNDYVYFESDDGKRYQLSHYQDCCESVDVDSVCGDVTDLIGFPIVEAEEEVYDNEDYPGIDKPSECYESFTWTIYKFRTTKGYVVIRWLGQSNGYYSEGVDFNEIK